jgi:hypothetical protein
VLIHDNYLSQKDIEICMEFDVASLGDEAPTESTSPLHYALTTEYGGDD